MIQNNGKDQTKTNFVTQENSKNLLIMNESTSNLLQIDGGIVKGDKIYSTFSFYNAACVIHMPSGNVDVFFPVINEPLYKEGLHLVVEKLSDWLVLIPHGSSNLVFFNLCAGYNITYDCGGDYLFNYNRAFFYNKKIFLLPVFRPDIGVFDIINHTLDFYKIPLYNSEIKFDCNIRFAVTSSCVAENRVFLLCSNPNLIIEFNCDDYTYLFHFDLYDCMSMSYDGFNFWIGRKDKTILKINLESNKRKFIKDLPKDFWASDMLPLSTSVYIERRILILSHDANMILRINIDTDVIDKLHLPEEDSINYAEMRQEKYTLIGSDRTYIYLFSRKQTAIVKSNVITNTYEIIPFNLKIENIEFFNNGGLLFGKKECGLNFFVKQFWRLYQCENRSKVKYYGQEIYNYIRKQH